MEVPKWLERTELLIGNEALEKLKNAHVLVVGLGGVGSYAGEFVVRAGIGSITIIDGDIVDITNINRQMQALHSTIGMSKAQILKQRFIDINPELNVFTYDKFMEPEDMQQLLQDNNFDFIMDCIDSVKPKLTLIEMAKKLNCKIISSMGAGGKLDPSKIKVGDIFTTKECKFAQTLKKRLKRMDIKRGILCVYSEDIQIKSSLKMTDGSNYKRSFYGTISYMPSLFGLTVASEVIQRVGGLGEKT